MYLTPLVCSVSVTLWLKVIPQTVARCLARAYRGYYAFCQCLYALCSTQRLLNDSQLQGRIQPVRLGRVISDLTLTVKSHYRLTTVSQTKYTSQQNNGRQNGLISRMLFSEMQKNMVKKVTFLGFSWGDRPSRPPLDPPLASSLAKVTLLPFPVRGHKGLTCQKAEPQTWQIIWPSWPETFWITWFSSQSCQGAEKIRRQVDQ